MSRRMSDLTSSALQQHAQVYSALVQMSRSIEWLEPNEPDPQVFDRVTAQLGALHEQLARHFVAEEGSRLHERLLRLVPDASTEIGQLVAEHQVILDNIEAARLRAQVCSPMHVERLRADLELVLEILYTHEAVEDQLMSRAFDAMEELPSSL